MADDADDADAVSTNKPVNEGQEVQEGERDTTGSAEPRSLTDTADATVQLSSSLVSMMEALRSLNDDWEKTIPGYHAEWMQETSDDLEKLRESIQFILKRVVIQIIVNAKKEKKQTDAAESLD